ncbi:MAG: polysaccharide biosynthesis/export family protein [Bacteroidota bacterium]
MKRKTLEKIDVHDLVKKKGKNQFTTAYVLSLLVLTCILPACISYPSLVSYNQAPRITTTPQAITNFQAIKVQIGDVLKIRLSSTDAASIQPFTIAAAGAGTGQAAAGGSANDYLVDSDGNIEFPTIGSIPVKGLELEAIEEALATRLSAYFKQPPIIQVRLINFKVNVNGEVNSPGSFLVGSDRMSIIEAISQAGDFTPYSRRDSILIIREEDGMREFGYISFNSAEIFDSPYFYLQQNDVVYVQPDKTKVGSLREPSNRFIPWVTAFVSLAALIVSITR